MLEVMLIDYINSYAIIYAIDYDIHDVNNTNI